MTCPGPSITCIVEDCQDPARRSGLCWGHLRQRQRKAVVGEKRAWGQGPKRVLMEAIFDLVEVDASDKVVWERAWLRVRVAARRYVFADKPTDPRRRGKR
ncbi:hypothetical protein D7X74_30465 [Corallococcus sp. CA047B]|uniref:hypothetical protein n=1 Tax=Corallococcus sp. CA047B TaxID=2316729 RepID=UPI000EA3DCE6|nr:hypothetical protein [Corallococcus sp. CA047B]RKH09008.1 hypothetical protein D7X74_30465 [Corallococcus sp. CA047B]